MAKPNEVTLKLRIDNAELNDAVVKANAALAKIGTTVDLSKLVRQVDAIAAGANAAQKSYQTVQLPGGGSAKIINTNTTAGTAAAQFQKLTGGLTAGGFNALGSSARGALSAVSGLGAGLSKVQSNLIALGATIYSLRSVGQFIRSYLVLPFEELGRAMIDADEESRKFEYGLSGIVGSMEKARNINSALVRATRDLPISITDARESARALSSLPAFAGNVASANPNDFVRQAIDFGNISRKLAVIDPQQEKGSLIALRQIIEGGGADAFVSIRRRFGITARQIARAAGTEVENISRDPALALSGVRAIVNALIPDSVVQKNNNLISTRVLKLRDSLKDALTRVADSGVFDSTVKRLDNLGKQIFGYLDSNEFRTTAARVSRSLDNIIGNVGRAGEKFLRAFTGTTGDMSTVQGFASAFSDVLERISRLSDNLPSVLNELGKAAGAISGRVGEFVDAVITLADAARDPAQFAKNAATRAVTAGPTNGATRGGVDERMIAILKSAGIDTGLIGRRYFDPKTDSGNLYNQLRSEGSSAVGAFLQSIPEAARGLLGSRSVVEQLDFSKLDPRRRAIAEKIYSALIGGGSVSSDLLAKLGANDSSSVPYGKLGAFIRAELSAPNYGATLLTAGKSFGNLNELAGDVPSNLEKLVGAAGAAKNSGIVAMEQLANQRDEALKLIGEAMRDGAAEYAKSLNSDVLVYLRVAEKTGRETVEGFDKARDLLAQSIIAGANDYVLGLSKELSDTPLASKFLETVADGSNAFAQQIRDVLTALGAKVTDKLGIDALPLNERAAFTSRLIDSRSRDAELRARLGNISAGMSAGEVSAAFNNRELSRDALLRMQQTVESGNLSIQAGIVNAARDNLANNPNDPFALKLSAGAVVRYGELAEKLEDLRNSLDYVRAGFVEFSVSVRGALENSLGSAIERLITGAGRLSDVFKSLASDVIQSFSRMAASNVLRALIGSDFGSGGAASLQLGGLFAPIGRLFSGSSAGGNFSGWNFGGGVQKFASGGVVSQPTRALIGEGGASEAIIPLSGGSVPLAYGAGGMVATLPGGRSVPARFSHTSVSGAMGSHSPAAFAPNFYIVNDARALVSAGFKENKDFMVDVIAGNIARGGKVIKSLKRR